MYLHIGGDFIVNSKSIIGMYTIDYVKNTKEYKSMYNELDNNQCLYMISDKKNKTFIVTEEKGLNKGYLTNLSVNTILKRLI